ncbi:histidine phosphatase family protein [Ruficoccus amylovorans]|uniref:Histidine phosphatase family protein n=1 Tax=Ruficoccus amylovorans TaxID=1804625 RepID=A0A842HKQ6_9BACT|nr:histidine phosphatase family protein [Ruficoccus amylovorans]MBC2596057.1 histidine phosphatase family protein [Ruficoccus amylovorans]
MAEDTRKQVLVFRHGQTEWSLNGKHTSISDIELTDEGHRGAVALRPLVQQWKFSLVLSSPLKRARETCELAGLGDLMEIDPDLMEWNYGQYEGLTTEEIRRKVPGWGIFTHPVPGGETPGEVAARCDRVINRILDAAGDVAIFAHGHYLRVFAARWLKLAPEQGQHFVLDTSSLNRLGYEHETRAILTWNATIGG